MRQFCGPRTRVGSGTSRRVGESVRLSKMSSKLKGRLWCPDLCQRQKSADCPWIHRSGDKQCCGASWPPARSRLTVTALWCKYAPCASCSVVYRENINILHARRWAGIKCHSRFLPTLVDLPVYACWSISEHRCLFFEQQDLSTAIFFLWVSQTTSVMHS